MKVMIVIAAYNEESAIGDVIKDLHKHDYNHIIVVDDGSKDNTSEAAKGSIVVKHAINRGQGAALRTGLQAALDDGADIIVTFDADGQHQAKDLPKSIDPIKEGKAQAVLGSRFIGGLTKMPWTRKLLLKGSIIIQYLFYGIKLTDAHSGLRALHKDAAAKIEIRSDGMAHSHEFAEQIHKKQITFIEVPIDVKYTEYAMSKGHGSYKQACKVLLAMVKDKLIK